MCVCMKHCDIFIIFAFCSCDVDSYISTIHLNNSIQHVLKQLPICLIFLFWLIFSKKDINNIKTCREFFHSILVQIQRLVKFCSCFCLRFLHFYGPKFIFRFKARQLLDVRLFHNPFLLTGFLISDWTENFFMSKSI